MTNAFRPRLDILPSAQRRLWDELAGVPAHFILYGGTALALHLGHRQSEDFDFFADQDIDPFALHRTTPFLQSAEITQQEPNTLTCLVDRGGPVKVSFFGLPHLARIRLPVVAEDNGIKIASLLDIAGTKAAVVQQRAHAKDYIDIDALITQGRLDLPMHLAAARAVYGPHFAPTPTLKALTYFGDGDLGSVPSDVKDRLMRAASAVDPLRLPSLDRAATPPRSGKQSGKK
jgi:nucleotidyltransferase AbiEii toxin of type IV toxin-antitoxin system